MTSINLLPSATVRLISSTQVITSVASVVKELVENSLDANSTTIEVKLENFGLDKIEVRDDGNGIMHDDTQYMAQPHYTSKISGHCDLEKLHTYGFRGEALGALCAVAHVSITTKTADDEVSMMYSIDTQGKVISCKPSHFGQGTTITACDLFKNLPVRKQYFGNMKRRKEELKKAEEVFMAIGIIHPSVRMVLRHNKDVIWLKNKADDHRTVLQGVLGADVMSCMNNFNHREELSPGQVINIEGYLPDIDSPSHLTSRTNHERFYCYINRRHVIMKEITKVVRRYYTQALTSDSSRYPVGIINITVPPELVDVNLEPNKTKVLLENLHVILRLIETILVKIYGPLKSTSKHSQEPVPVGDSQLNDTLSQSDESICSVVDNGGVGVKTFRCLPQKSGRIVNENRSSEHHNKKCFSAVDVGNLPVSKPSEETDTTKCVRRKDAIAVLSEQSSLDFPIIFDSQNCTAAPSSNSCVKIFDTIAGKTDGSNSEIRKELTCQDESTSANNSSQNGHGILENSCRFNVVIDENQNQESLKRLRDEKFIGCDEILRKDHVDNTITSGGFIHEQNSGDMSLFDLSMDDVISEWQHNEGKIVETMDDGNPSELNETIIPPAMDISIETTLEGTLPDRRPDLSATAESRTTTNEEMSPSITKSWSVGRSFDKSVEPVKLLMAPSTSGLQTTISSLPSWTPTRKLNSTKLTASTIKRKSLCQAEPRPKTLLDLYCKGDTKPLTAYEIFAKENHERVSKGNDLSEQALIKKVSDSWKCLTKDEKFEYEAKELQGRESFWNRRVEENKKHSPPTSHSPPASHPHSIHPSSPHIIQPSKRRKIDQRKKTLKSQYKSDTTVEFSLSSLKAKFSDGFLSTQTRQSGTVEDASYPVGLVASVDLWVCCRGSKLVMLNHNRAQETVAYHHLLRNHIVESETLETPIVLTHRSFGDVSLWTTLCDLPVTRSAGQTWPLVTDERLTKNGFDIYQVSDDENDVVYEIRSMCQMIPCYGLEDLKNVLDKICTLSPIDPFSQYRPLKVINYLKGEAVRIGRQVSRRISRADLEALLDEMTHLPSTIDTCIHDRSLCHVLYDVANMSSSSQHCK